MGFHRGLHDTGATLAVLLMIGLVAGLLPLPPSTVSAIGGPSPTGPGAPGPTVAPQGTLVPSGGPVGSPALSVVAPPVPVPPAGPVEPTPSATRSSIGQVVQTLNVGSNPIGVVTDPVSGYVYVANFNSNTVSIFNRTVPLTTVSVAAEPEGGVYDPSTGNVLISCYGAHSVEILHGVGTVGSVSVGAGPYPGTYDAATGQIYIPNEQSSNVSLVQGTSIAGSISLGTGVSPVSAAYDPSTGDVYVSEYSAHAVAVLSGTSLIGTVGVGGLPGGLVYDPADQQVYVANPGANNYTTISGLSVTATVPLHYSVWAAAYDAENQAVYFTDNGLNANITAVAQSTVLGTLAVGPNPLGIAFDAPTGALFVSSSDGGDVSVVSTGLLVGAPSMVPKGDPSNSTDVGLQINLTAPVDGNASWTFTASVNASGTLGCVAAPITVTGTPGSLGVGQFSATCRPTLAGTFLVLLTVNASGRIGVASPITLVVNPRFSLGIPVASFGATHGITSTDATVHVAFNLTPIGGSGLYASIVWSGVPVNACIGEISATMTCAFPSAGHLSISVSATDTDGGSATSPGLGFTVETQPVVSPPVANRSASDVGQTTGFNTSAAGGSGGYTFHWLGVPASCATTSAPSLQCAPTTAGILSVSVYANDTNGGVSATSQAVDVFVFADPVVPAPVASPAQVGTGALFTLSVNVSGGPPGNDSIAWEGVPTGACSYSTPIASSATCRTDTPGTYEVYVLVTDGNEFTIRSPAVQVQVSGNVGPIGSGGTNGSSTFLGLPMADGIGLVLVVLVMLLIVALLIFNRRRSAGPEEMAPAGPPAEGEETSEEEPPTEEEYAAADDGYEDEGPYEGDGETGGTEDGSAPYAEDGTPPDDGSGTDDYGPSYEGEGPGDRDPAP